MSVGLMPLARYENNQSVITTDTDMACHFFKFTNALRFKICQ
jgi:hypothetical protein